MSTRGPLKNTHPLNKIMDCCRIDDKPLYKAMRFRNTYMHHLIIGPPRVKVPGLCGVQSWIGLIYLCRGFMCCYNGVRCGLVFVIRRCCHEIRSNIWNKCSLYFLDTIIHNIKEVTEVICKCNHRRIIRQEKGTCNFHSKTRNLFIFL